MLQKESSVDRAQGFRQAGRFAATEPHPALHSFPYLQGVSSGPPQGSLHCCETVRNYRLEMDWGFWFLFF